MSDGRGRALVACPTYAGKEYALDAWLAGCRALTYEPKSIYTVDNTRVSLAYYELLRTKGIDVTHLTPWPDWDRTFRRCWELILKRARDLDCYWIYSVEADNVPAPESLDIMVNLALYGKVHLVTHAYPMHATAARASGVPENSFYYHELGCMLLSRRLLERAIDEFEEYGHIVSAIFGSESRYHGGYIKLTSAFEVQHLDGYEMSFENLGPSEMPGLTYPVPSMPADMGTQLPPSLRTEMENAKP
jgi:hypothetical protein